MAQAKTGDTVRTHYNGTLEDGSVFDSSLERDPLEFTLGSGMVIPGFESAVIGLSVGESAQVTIPSDKAYGPYRDDLVGKIDRSQFPTELVPEVGMMLQASSPDGPPMNVRIKEFDGETVTLDANHPLAGKQLNFNITLVEIIAA